MENTIKKMGLLFIILAMLALSSVIVAVALSIAGSDIIGSGNVAVIPIKGEIAAVSDTWTTYANPDDIVPWIEEADQDPTVKIIVLEIDSPGGTPVASDEIAQAILHTNKTTVAYIRETGASGAYWIASSTDYIIANRMSMTGSIGVTGSYIEWAGTLRRFNATYREYHAGAYKELGNPFADATPEQQTLYQKKIEKLQSFFVEHVREQRNLTDDEVTAISTGEPFLGVEALDLHLVDELGGKAELEAYLNATMGEKPSYRYYERTPSLLETLGIMKSSVAPSAQESLQTSAAYEGVTTRT